MLTFFLAKSPEAPPMTMAVLVVRACWSLPDDALRISPVFSEEGTAAMDASISPLEAPCRVNGEEGVSGGEDLISPSVLGLVGPKSLLGLSITKQQYLVSSSEFTADHA